MVIVKRGWKKITDPKILNVYNEVCEEARDRGLLKTENPPLYSNKSYRNLGMCYSKKEFGQYLHSIVLSEYILTDPEKFRGVMIHELGHAICPKDHHGATWKHNTGLIGKRWGYTSERLCNDEELCNAMNAHRPVREFKYEIYCPKCNATWKYKMQCNAVKSPENYRCGRCKCNLESREI